MTQVQERTQTSNRKLFYNKSLPTALREAWAYAGKDGFVYSMPQLLQERSTNLDDKELWDNWFYVLSEENVGIDKEGRFGKKNKPVVIGVHGGGILTIDRIQEAYKEGLINYAGRLSQEHEIEPLLAGQLPDGTNIPLFSLKQYIDGVSDLPVRHAVVMPLETLENLKSGVQDIVSLKDNPLLIVRAGGVEKARKYLGAAEIKYYTKTLGNWHPFRNVDPKKAQGRLLYLGSYYYGLIGLSVLNDDARFVGVRAAQGAPAQKISRPTLEQVLKSSQGFVPEVARKEYEAKLRELYK